MNNYTLSDLFLARFRQRNLVCSIRKIGNVIKEIRASKGGEVLSWNTRQKYRLGLRMVIKHTLQYDNAQDKNEK